MAKKKDLPAMPFYFGDWRKAPEIRALDLDARMIWFEMLGYMWESTERGFLTLNGNPIPHEMLARMLNVSPERLTLYLTLMLTFGVYSVREKDGAIFSRKMVRDEEIRQKRATGGKKGGNPNLKVNLKGYHTSYPSSESENEYENEIEKKEKGGVGENLDGTIIGEMLAVYCAAIPEYESMPEYDIAPLGQIIKFIKKKENLGKDPATDSSAKAVVLAIWGGICDFVSKDTFHRNQGLKTHATHIQTIIQKIKNGTGNSASKTGQRVDVASAFEKLNQFSD